MMFSFILPLVLGFSFNLASAFTTVYTKRYGERRGTFISALLRNVLGIPVWAFGIVLAVRASSIWLFQRSFLSNLLGWVLLSLGGVIILSSLATLRSRSAAPNINDQLANTKIYARVRHPIYSGAFLEFTGQFLIVPSLEVAIASLLGVIWLFLQTWFEEIDLLNRIPEYREYMSNVPRFIPRLKH